MKLYKRVKGSNIWHWCITCSNYPAGKETEKLYVESYDEKPYEGKLCPECKRRQLVEKEKYK